MNDAVNFKIFDACKDLASHDEVLTSSHPTYHQVAHESVEHFLNVCRYFLSTYNPRSTIVNDTVNNVRVIFNIHKINEEHNQKGDQSNDRYFKVPLRELEFCSSSDSICTTVMAFAQRNSASHIEGTYLVSVKRIVYVFD